MASRNKSESFSVAPETRFEIDAQKMRQLDARHKLPAFIGLEDYAERGPLIIVRGKGAKVWDVEGREFIDASAAIWNVNLGFGREEIAQAVYQQLTTLSFHLSLLDISTPPAIELAARLAELAPDGLNRVLFTSGGSEANESVIRIARLYFHLKGRPEKIIGIGRRLGYHGSSCGAATLTGIDHFHEGFGPLLPGITHIEPPYCYRCPLGKEYPACAVACADELEKAILAHGPERVAFFIAEPVMGAGGVIPAPREYWTRIREICDKYEVLLVADEVITGAGRTGKMFATEHWEVAPDILVCAKGISSGYLPLGAVIVHDRIYETLLANSQGRALWHGYTNTGNPACCAAGLKTLEIMEREGLVQNAERMGARLLAGLAAFKNSPIVGDVRGLGLMAAVELVRDKASREPFPRSLAVGVRFRDAARRHGLLIRAIGDIICMSPPLTVSEAEVDSIIKRFGDALAEVEASLADVRPTER